MPMKLVNDSLLIALAYSVVTLMVVSKDDKIINNPIVFVPAVNILLLLQPMIEPPLGSLESFCILKLFA